jgi:hypothetical protein
MIVTAVMAAICTAGVAFYVRFFVELCKECKQRCICYLVRLESHASECSVLDSENQEVSFREAA